MTCWNAHYSISTMKCALIVSKPFFNFLYFLIRLRFLCLLLITLVKMSNQGSKFFSFQIYTQVFIFIDKWGCDECHCQSRFPSNFERESWFIYLYCIWRCDACMILVRTCEWIYTTNSKCINYSLWFYFYAMHTLCILHNIIHIHILKWIIFARNT